MLYLRKKRKAGGRQHVNDDDGKVDEGNIVERVDSVWQEARRRRHHETPREWQEMGKR